MFTLGGGTGKEGAPLYERDPLRNIGREGERVQTTAERKPVADEIISDIIAIQRFAEQYPDMVYDLHKESHRVMADLIKTRFALRAEVLSQLG